MYGALVRRLLTAGVLGGTLTAASPQAGTVRGEITLLERSGVSRRDVQTAVIYLEALDALADDDHGNVSTEATIAMRGREFLPHTAVIRSGGAVKFPNQDPFSHNVFSNSEPVAFDLGLYRRGVTRSASFARPGVYPIYCNIHAKMVSYVVAVPGRHVTFAGPDGRYELTDVPVGTYRLHVWHERAARVSAVVTVTPTGATLPMTLDARGWISGAHLNKFGAPYTSTRADRY
jgi:plastocyanin